MARGSGAAVAQLGAVARQAGTPVSLHGTGGAWLFAGRAADADRFRASVVHSLDRKVCNTLNVCCLPAGRPDLVAAFLEGARRRRAAGGARRPGCTSRRGSLDAVPAERFQPQVKVGRADGEHVEPAASPLPTGELGREWEWEDVPGGVAARHRRRRRGRRACNRYSPRFIASLVSEDDGRARPLLRRRRRAVRRRRLHPLGRRPVRPRHARARAVQLAGRPPARPAAACCRATRCTPSATAPASSTPSSTADARRSLLAAVGPRGVQPRPACAPSRRRAGRHHRPTTRRRRPPPTDPRPRRPTTRRRRRHDSSDGAVGGARRNRADDRGRTTGRRRGSATRCSRSSAPTTSTCSPTTCASPTTRHAATRRRRDVHGPGRPAPDEIVLDAAEPRRGGRDRRRRSRPTFERRRRRARRSARRRPAGTTVHRRIDVTYTDQASPPSRRGRTRRVGLFADRRRARSSSTSPTAPGRGCRATTTRPTRRRGASSSRSRPASTAVANGELVEQRSDADGDTWVWEQRQPMATYLVQVLTGRLRGPRRRRGRRRADRQRRADRRRRADGSPTST